MPQIERSIDIRASIEQVFAFVSDVRNHHRVAPPESREELLDAGDIPMQLGTIVRFRARYGGVSWILASRITVFDPPNADHPHHAHFRDEQIHGPFKIWSHDHWFTTTPTGIRLTDRFTYAAPFGLLGKLVERLWLHRQLIALVTHMQGAQKRILEAS